METQMRGRRGNQRVAPRAGEGTGERWRCGQAPCKCEESVSVNVGAGRRLGGHHTLIHRGELPAQACEGR